MSRLMELRDTSAPTITIPTDRQDFLQVRTTGIGGSDAATILGINPYKTPFELAEEKLGRVEPFKGNRFTEAGNRLEEVIAQWYADETQSKVARANQTFRLKEHPFIMAHIDRRVLNQKKVLECKSADKWTLSKWGSSGSDDVPDTYFIQVQHYLMFPNWENADLAALIGGNDLRIYPITPDTELQEMILQAEIAFWDTICRGDLPDPMTDSDAAKRWPKGNEESIYADYQVMEWERELQKATVSKKELEAKMEDLRVKIKGFMKEYTVLCDPDGNKLHTWKEQKLSSFKEKDLKAQHPDVYQACLKPKFDRNTCKSLYPEIYTRFQSTGRVFR
jgi:putative phage-type endonuclease